MFEDMFCCCWQVDVLFEEERGFWSAVYELIATTKRPIIMTCNGEWRGGEGRVVGREEGVCPVTILCGDHGSGKTAAVYACAQELGYKVRGEEKGASCEELCVIATYSQHELFGNPFSNFPLGV